jgi:hypothetical protein
MLASWAAEFISGDMCLWGRDRAGVARSFCVARRPQWVIGAAARQHGALLLVLLHA